MFCFADSCSNGQVLYLTNWLVLKTSGGPGKEALRDLNYFIERYDGGVWKKGTVLEFLRLQEGRVAVRVNGRDALTVQSEAFSWALFDAYLGKKGHLTTPARIELLERTKEIAELLKEHS